MQKGFFAKAQETPLYGPEGSAGSSCAVLGLDSPDTSKATAGYTNAEATEPPKFAAGQRVVAKDLASAQHLNGLVGTVKGFNQEKGRFQVEFPNIKDPKLLKADNLDVAPEDAKRAKVKEIFASDVESMRKLTNLAQNGEQIGMEHLDSPALCKMLHQLLEVGYFEASPDMENMLQQTLELAEHPSGPEAIKLIKRLNTTDAADINDRLTEMGEQIKQDEGLGFIFGKLKEMGHQFDF